ncbi:MAG: hypothetical protein HZC42_06435 [Candidatus Eisenbacteria bacterium]|nr:hypothetical protein [Candidatus Eisenbacteria bacterium]
MRSLGRSLGLGVLMWLIPFVVAFISFPLRGPARPLFESIMAVTVTGSAVVLGLAWLGRVERRPVRDGFLVGILWFAVCILIDAPLMLAGGPMHMSFADYMADIGLTYAGIPLVTTGLAAARSAGTARGAAAPSATAAG